MDLNKYIGQVFTHDIANQITRDINKSYKTSTHITSKFAQATNDLNSALKNAATSSSNFNTNLIDLAINIKNIIANIKDFDVKNLLISFYGLTTPLFQLDAALRERVNRQLGITGERAEELRNQILNASTDLLNYGIEVEDVINTISTLTNETNRAVSIGTEQLEDFIKLSRASGLSAEEGALFLTKMEGVGRSLLSGQDALTDMQNIATTMGLSSTNLIKTATENLSLINRFGFERGIRGFSEISAKASLIKFDLKSASEFADSLFDVDKAIEAAAQLNILGGEFGNLSNATDLMFKATNDYAGLTEEIMNAQKQFVTFNQQTGEFETDGLGLRRAREFAKVVGKSVDTVIEEAKRASRFDLLSEKLNLFPSLDNQQKELIKNLGSINEKGEIEINGKSLSEINSKELQKELNKLQQQQIDDEKTQIDILRDQRNIAAMGNDYLRMMALQAGTMQFGSNNTSVYSLMTNDLRDIMNEFITKYTPEQIKDTFGTSTLSLDDVFNFIMDEKPETMSAKVSDFNYELVDKFKENFNDVLNHMNEGYSDNKPVTVSATKNEVENAQKTFNVLSRLDKNLDKGFNLGGTINVNVQDATGYTLTREQYKVISRIVESNTFDLVPDK